MADDAQSLLQATEFDPLTAEFREDPYAVYGRLRGTPGLVYWEYGDMWVAARHSDVVTVLNEPRLRVGAPEEVRERFAAVAPPSLVPLFGTVLYEDPPEHTRLRALVSRAFTARRVQALAARAQELVDAAFDQAERSGEMEVIADLAYPLPVVIICELLGVPPEDRDLFREWASALSGLADIPVQAEAVEPAARAAEEFYDYFERLLAKRPSADEGQDLLSALRAATVDGSRLTHDELLAMAVLILCSGHETIVSLIGNTVLTFIQHPDQLSLLRQRPELVDNAVDEMLRFQSPLQAATGGGGRWVGESLELAGTKLPEGERVLALLGSANRDPEVFADPDRFDVTRTDIRAHLAFGHGAHACFGSALGRLQGAAVVRALVERPLDLTLLEKEPNWRESFILRELTSLPLGVRQAG
ncbi:MAG: cytochrome P450 [Streptomyces sp.]|nr:cytochrome P450 [Streptomyces sp.]